MAQINQKLESLEKTTQDIMQFLEVGRRSELNAQQQFLYETQKNIRYLIGNPVQQQATLTTIQSIRRDALASINFYKTQIEIAKARLVKANEEKSIDKKLTESSLGEVILYIPTYWQALYQYSLAYLLEVLLAQNDDHEYLVAVQEDLEKKCKEYEDYVKSCIRKTEDVIVSGKALEPIEAKIYGALQMLFKCSDISLDVSSRLSYSIGMAAGLQAARLPVEFLAEAVGTAKKKANDKARSETLEDFSKCISACTDLTRIRAAGSGIKMMDKWANESQEILIKKGQVYVMEALAQEA